MKNTQKYTIEQVASEFSFKLIKEAIFALSDYDETPAQQGYKSKDAMIMAIMEDLDDSSGEDIFDYLKMIKS
jgi:hypothetical protein